MSGTIFWRILATVLVVAFALMSSFPYQDTPFEDFIKEQIDQDKEAFEKILSEAEKEVQKGQFQSLFLAINGIAKRDKIDLSKFFPEISLTDVKNLEKRNAILMDELLRRSQGKIKQGLDLKGGVAFTLAVGDNDQEDGVMEEERLSKAIDILRGRIDSLGLTEPIIRARGDQMIEVQLPGLSTRDNPDVAKQLRKPAKLEFSEVYRRNQDPIDPNEKPPLGQKLVFQEQELPDGTIVEIPLYVSRIPLATGDIIADAFPYPNEYGGYEISLQFTDAGSKIFAEITKNLANKGTPNNLSRLAVILDGKLYSAPTVSQEIRGGGASITGQFTQREAIELSSVLNNPLNVELSVEEMYEVGATLAEDAKNSSINAALMAALVVAIFMIAYYGVSGVVSVISILINLLIVVGILANIGATWTLPSVAALVLTVGMAVDANILIFERIREELRLGKKPLTSLLGGYEKAFSTIVDANVTTLITAMILMGLGQGPVKGFGITLAVGICSSMFCALVVSRFLLEFIISKGITTRILGWKGWSNPSVDFLNFRKPAFILSWVVVLVGIITFTNRIENIFGIDFKGGEELTVSFEERIPSKSIETISAEQSLGEVLVNYQTDLSTGREILKIQTELGKGQSVFASLAEQFKDSSLTLEGISVIGSAVSDEITRNAFWSVLVALLGILLYVAFRFELGYGIGAIVATIHDVLMSIGIYVLLGGQFSAPMLAAVLMILGYSINDTIVVFDRIREELDLNPGSNLKKIINLAISCTLSRSILTSITTFSASIILYCFGAGVINDFALIFTIGIITGTFSSIFIASPIFYWWHRGNRSSVEADSLQPRSYEWEKSNQT